MKHFLPQKLCCAVGRWPPAKHEVGVFPQQSYARHSLYQVTVASARAQRLVIVAVGIWPHVHVACLNEPASSGPSTSAPSTKQTTLLAEKVSTRLNEARMFADHEAMLVFPFTQ